MFKDCSALLNLDVSNFNTSKFIMTSFMFSGLDEITSLNLSNFDTSNVVNMEGMFYHCELETLDVSSFDTTYVEDMKTMFSSCHLLQVLMFPVLRRVLTWKAWMRCFKFRRYLYYILKTLLHPKSST